MIFTIYEPLVYVEERGLVANQVACFIEAESYEYRKHWREVGSFTLVVPTTSEGIHDVTGDMILFVDEGREGTTNDSLIITEVYDDGKHVTLKGMDMKGLLSFRDTLFPQAEIEAGTYGYDVRQGTTGEILSGYITYNCIDATDPNRNIPGLIIGNVYGGLNEDTYMSRLQPLSDVVIAICKNADIGWDISFSGSAIVPYYMFNTVQGEDKTNETGSPKCVFADYLYNAESITKELKTSERKNVIWTVNGNDADGAVVTSIYKSDETEQISGFKRRETVLTANCDLDLTEAYVDTKTTDMVDKLQVGFVLADPSLYGTLFNIGDKVTAIQRGIAYDRRIIEVHKSYNGEKKAIRVQLGDIPAKKYFDRTSTDLSNRADDVKELALETAKVKQETAEIKHNTFYDSQDPTIDPNNTVEVGDIWFNYDSNRFIQGIYRYELLVDVAPESEGEEDNDEEEETLPWYFRRDDNGNLEYIDTTPSPGDIDISNPPVYGWVLVCRVSPTYQQMLFESVRRTRITNGQEDM